MIYTSAEIILQIKEIEPAISIEENTNLTSGSINKKMKQVKYVVKYARMIYTSAGLVLQIKIQNRRQKITTSTTGYIQQDQYRKLRNRTGDINRRKYQLQRPAQSTTQRNDGIFTHDLQFSRISNQIKKQNRRYQLKKIPASTTGTISTTTKEVKYPRLIYTPAENQIKKQKDLSN